EWHAFVEGTGTPAQHVLELFLAAKHFQPLLGETSLKITSVKLFAKRSSGHADLSVEFKQPGQALAMAFDENDTLAVTGTNFGSEILQGATVNVDLALVAEPLPWKLRVGAVEDTALDDIWIVCTYAH
ncbi:MAG TPA: hypothetical protein PK156_39390, partial [Polyangium sp.]|nr:hypothetical protein [Polyangium sp.]